MTDTNTVTITQDVVAVTVNRGRFGVTRKIASSRVNTTAKKSLVKATKKLIESKRYLAITHLDTDVRRYLLSSALPTPMNNGTFIVPMGLVEGMEQRLKQYHEEREQLVDAFITEYPLLRSEAKTALGDLYREADYPDAEQVREAFTFTWRYIAFETPSQLQKVNASLWQEACAKNEAAMQETAEMCRQTLRAAVMQMVQHMRERLTLDANGKRKIFRDSLVTNMVEFLRTFHLRDVTDDTELQEAVKKMQAMLKGIDPDILRDDESARRMTLRCAGQICRTLDQMAVTSKPIRLIGDDD